MVRLGAWDVPLGGNRLCIGFQNGKMHVCRMLFYAICGIRSCQNIDFLSSGEKFFPRIVKTFRKNSL